MIRLAMDGGGRKGNRKKESIRMSEKLRMEGGGRKRNKGKSKEGKHKTEVKEKEEKRM